MAIINTLNNILASIASVPMMLESGLSWDKSLTEFLVKNSPFTIRLYDTDRIELVNKNGEWLLHTSPIVKCEYFDNGYVYFLTASNHKYQFTICEQEKKSFAKFPLAQPEKETVKQYVSFSDLSYSDKRTFWDSKYYYLNKAARIDGKAIGELSAKRADYGFVDGVFCHVSDCADKISSLTEFNGEDVIGEVVTTNRGQKLVNYTFDDGVVGKYIMEAEEMYIKSINDNLLETANWRYERLMKDYNAQKDAWGQLGFCALDKKYESTHKAYMDNKSETTFTFSRSISKDEFYSYLGFLGYEIKEEKSGWWDDYSMIDGADNTWTYTWVHTSTH